MEYSDYPQTTYGSSSSRSRVNYAKQVGITCQSTADPTSSSQSLSSARKRHFHEVNQDKSHQGYDDGDEKGAVEDASDGQPDQKRSRPSPQTSSVDLREFGSLSSTRRRHKQTASSASNHNRLHGRRTSRFVEGSMRDRASPRPPDDFTHDESTSRRSISEQREQYSEETHASCGTKIKVVRPSGMQRFGKALATTLSPTSVLHNSHARSKSMQESRANVEQPTWDDRRTEAKVAYADLKRNSYSGTRRTPTYSSKASASTSSLGRQVTDYQALLKRNSYADRTEDGHVHGSHRNRPLAHTVKLERNTPSPFPELVVAPTIETDLREHQFFSPPALEHPLSSLKKVRSYFRFPGTKRPSLSPCRESRTSEASISTKNTGSLKESPSKKDLKKQKKLINKISNLEDKLEHAKQNLQRTLEEAPPIPSMPLAYTVNAEETAFKPESTPSVEPVATARPARFVPGLLPSLPSERLFNPKDRAIHEELLHRKNSFLEEQSVKATSRKKLSHVTPELIVSGSGLPSTLHSSASNLRREPPSSEMEPVKPKVSTIRSYVDDVAQGSGNENANDACDKPCVPAVTAPLLKSFSVRAQTSGLVLPLADRTHVSSNQKGGSKGSKKKKHEMMQRSGSTSSDELNNKSAFSPSLPSNLVPARLRKHRRSDSRILIDTTADSVNQSLNQGNHTRVDDQGNPALAASTKKHSGVPPLPTVPGNLQAVEKGKSGGKENRTKDERLSGVLEEEEFTWDEDVF